jgi:N-acetylneuraminate synthase
MSKKKDLILNSDEIWQMRGGIKAPAQEEQVTIDFAFATVCTKPIKKGEPFTMDNIWVTTRYRRDFSGTL